MQKIVISGGGVAGLAAAVTAAREGAKVLVLEEDARIGGSVTDYFIQYFCGKPMHGIFKELHDTMVKYDPCMENSENFHHPAYMMAWEEMMEGLDITIRTNEKVLDVACHEGRIESVSTPAGTYEADIFIDATGNGDIGAAAGCEWAYGREPANQYDEAPFAPEVPDDAVQRCTLMYTIARRPDCTSDEKVYWSYFSPKEYLVWGPSRVCADTLDPVALSEAQLDAQKEMPGIAAKWREKGYYVTSIAPKIGVRESRRMVGAYVLNYRDIVNQKTFPDSIQIAHYPIDPWEPSGNPFHKKDKSLCNVPFYEIPYRCLYSPKVSNLLFAGRCFSASHVANASARVMGIALVMGQAAGLAASMAAKGNGLVAAVDTAFLREKLHQQGVQTDLPHHEKE